MSFTNHDLGGCLNGTTTEMEILHYKRDKMKRTVRHRDYLLNHLKSPTQAAAYLSSVAEDGDIKFLLKALRHVVDAQGGVNELSKKTKLSRTTLYKTLSIDGNPEVKTLDIILKVYGIRIGFFANEIQHRRAA